MGAGHKQFVWGKEHWQLWRVGSLLPALIMLCFLSPPPSCPSVLAMPVLCLPPPSARGAMTSSVPPCWGSAWERGGGHLGSCCPQRCGTQGEGEERDPALGEGEIVWEEREETTFPRKKSLQFPPCIPSCKWLGRGLSTGLASPSACPPAADTRKKRKWKSKRNRQLQQNTPDFPFSSTCPSLPLPGRQTNVQ